MIIKTEEMLKNKGNTLLQVWKDQTDDSLNMFIECKCGSWYSKKVSIVRNTLVTYCDCCRAKERAKNATVSRTISTIKKYFKYKDNKDTVEFWETPDLSELL